MVLHADNPDGDPEVVPVEDQEGIQDHLEDKVSRRRKEDDLEEGREDSHRTVEDDRRHWDTEGGPAEDTEGRVELRRVPQGEVRDALEEGRERDRRTGGKEVLDQQCKSVTKIKALHAG